MLAGTGRFSMNSPFPILRSARRFAAAFLLGAGLLCTATFAQQPFPGEDDTWQYYQSPHFDLFTRGNNDSEARRVLFNLEVLRALLLDTFKVRDRRPVPVTVFLIPSARHFEAYCPERLRSHENLQSIYQSGTERGTLMITRAGDFDSALRQGFGGYSYHLFHMLGERPPPWLAQGVSRLFSTLEIDFDRVNFGHASPATVRYLQSERLLPLENLFAAGYGDTSLDDPERSSLFQAQSWALLHYWMLGQNKLPPGAVASFFAHALESARDYDAAATRRAFELNFGCDYGQMGREIESYIRAGTYRYAKLSLPKVAARETYTRRKVAREEIHLRLAELSWRMGRSAAGKLALLHAAGSEPADARALETLGAIAAFERDPNGQRERWAAALAAGSDNAALYREVAQLECARWLRNFDFHYRFPPELAAQLRGWLLEAIRRAPEQPMPYELLVQVEAFAPEPDLANVNLVQAKFPHLENKARAVLMLAVVRLRIGEKEKGLELLQQVDLLSPDLRTRRDAEKVLAIQEGRPPRRIEGGKQERPKQPSPRPRVP